MERFPKQRHPQDHQVLIGVKWVFKIKFKNGEYELHKTRIVALGYQQRKDVDYFERECVVYWYSI
jgi:hypothetical protein